MAPKAFRFDSALKMDRENGPIQAMGSIFGIEEGRESESEVVVRDMVSMRFHECKQKLIRRFMRRGQGP